MGGGAHLQRLFGVQKVRAMYFTGDMIDAAEAYRLGAVEQVVTRDAARRGARDRPQDRGEAAMVRSRRRR